MRPFEIMTSVGTDTFRFGEDFVDGEMRECWTWAGLEKLIRLGVWERRLDRRGTPLQKPPSVEAVRRLSTVRPLA